MLRYTAHSAPLKAYHRKKGAYASDPMLRTGAATARSMVSALWQAGQRAGPAHAPVYSTAHARQNVCPHAAPTASCQCPELCERVNRVWV